MCRQSRRIRARSVQPHFCPWWNRTPDPAAANRLLNGTRFAPRYLCMANCDIGPKCGDSPYTGPLADETMYSVSVPLFTPCLASPRKKPLSICMAFCATSPSFATGLPGTVINREIVTFPIEIFAQPLRNALPRGGPKTDVAHNAAR